MQLFTSHVIKNHSHVIIPESYSRFLFCSYDKEFRKVSTSTFQRLLDSWNNELLRFGTEMEFWNLNLEGTNRVHISSSEPENISRPKKHHFYYLELKTHSWSASKCKKWISKDNFQEPTWTNGKRYATRKSLPSPESTNHFELRNYLDLYWHHNSTTVKSTCRFIPFSVDF